ncbi:MAG: hypothetical protein ACD_20C00372G0001 [uncultured bacterium]|nr:MAG: hypothetical protein ACD_20C00372G0001 [uncultured bacterium]
MNKDEFVKKVMQRLNIEDKAVAERGVQIVLSVLSHRLTVEEASDVADQLPHELKRIWNNQVWVTNYFFLSGKRLKYRHKVELMSLVENEILREGLPLHAESLTKTVLHTLKEQITPGEAEDISAQLPDELREFFKAA